MKETIRPRLDQWEDDLEAEQVWRDAMNNSASAKPSVKVFRTGSAPAAAASTKPKSKFALAREKERSKVNQAQAFKIDLDAETVTSSNRKSLIPGMLGDITERESTLQPVIPPVASTSRNTGFPESKKRAASPDLKAQPVSITVEPEEDSEGDSDDAYAAISRENEERIASMSVAEIEQEQKELREMFDEKAIAFLMNRKHQGEAAKPATVPSRVPAASSPPIASTSNASHTPPAHHHHHHGPVFDRSGYRVASIQEQNHLHSGHLDVGSGNEYSLDTLFGMSHSTIPQQRAFALNLLERIATNNPTLPEVTKAVDSIAEIALALMPSPHRSVSTAALQLAEKMSSTITTFVTALLAHKPSIHIVIEQVLGSDLKTSQLASICRLIRNLNNSAELLQHLALVDQLQTLCLASNWPPPDTEAAMPVTECIDLLSDLVHHSREAAQTVFHELASFRFLNRYLVIPYWQLEPSDQAYVVGQDLLRKSLELLYALAHYGIACETRSSLPTVWTSFLSHAWTKEQAAVCISWIRLTRVWMTASLAPHDTMPEHSIDWSHVQEWGNKVVDLRKSDLWENQAVRNEVWKCLAIWKMGCERHKTACEVPSDMLDDDEAQHLMESLLLDNTIDSLDALFSALVFCQAFDRISDTDTATSNEVFDRIISLSPSPISISLLVSLLPYMKRSVLSKLLIISIAKGLEQSSIRKLQVELLHELSQSGNQLNLPISSILCPFFAAPAESSAEYFLQPASIKNITSLVAQNGQKESASCLWPLQVPLQELLHSAESKILRKLPDDWNFGEIEIVAAGLLTLKAMIQLLQEAALQTPSYAQALPSARQVQYELMRIFLLEAVDARLMTSDEAVFRDPHLTRLMEELLHISTTLPKKLEADPMQSPQFYAMYTDFLGLYDAMSLGHPVFGQLVLVPVLDSADFPLDYRRVLFVDYGHLLRNITVPLPAEFALEGMPIETDDTLLGSYLAAIAQKKILQSRNPALWAFSMYHLQGASRRDAKWKAVISREIGSLL